jgi:hypothetical protein
MDNLHNSYHGKVVNGVIVLENGAALPEGVAVKIELLEERLAPALPHNGQAMAEQKAASPLGEMLLKYAGVIDDLPADIARNHDHYLYGTPKVDEQ